MANDFTTQLGQRIKTARENAGLTQSQLAEIAEVSTNHISALERGVYDTRAELLAKIATALGVDANYLLLGYWEKKASKIRSWSARFDLRSRRESLKKSRN